MASPHPFQRYPYAWNAAPPHYVGPAWAAPAPLPPRPAPARKSGLGCGCLVAAFTLVALLAGGGFVLFVVALVLVDGDLTEEPATGPERAGGTGGGGSGGGPTTVPEDPTGKVRAKSDFGHCQPPEPASSPERRSATYLTTRDKGAARKLRGKSVIFHLRVERHGVEWKGAGKQNVLAMALSSTGFLTAQAQRHGITDLEAKGLVWHLPTKVTIPPLLGQADASLDDATRKQLIAAVHASVRDSLGSTLREVIRSQRARGYQEIGFLVHVPALGNEAKAREFAQSSASPDHDDPELAFVFSSPNESVAWSTVVATHESLHLFGADDIYQLRAVDPQDRNDLMAVPCSGLRPAVIGDATAYAIGWRTAPPARAYPFRDFW